MHKKQLASVLVLLLLIGGCTRLEDFSGENFESTPSEVSYDEVSYKEYELSESDLYLQLEAEDAAIQGAVAVKSERDGYSGEGYVSLLDESSASTWQLAAPISESGHYKLTLCLASDSEAFGYLLINGEITGDLRSYGSGSFETVVLDCIYLAKGEQTISISQHIGKVDIDYVLIEATKRISNEHYEVSSKLINPNVKGYTQALMDYLTDYYGKASISGQQVTGGTNMELELIKELTGKYPAIRSGDFGEYSLSKGGQGNGETELAAKWWQSGGIVAMSWYWYAPMGSPELLANKTSFNLASAMTEYDVATLSLKEIEQLEQDGTVSAELVALIRDIDNVSKQLILLQREKVPVLWRPLPQGGGNWYWWGSTGEASYKWLWKLLVDRQTKYHQLNNLIWVWNGQYSSYYPGDNYVDIISEDVFTLEHSASPQTQRFFSALKSTKTPKIVALSECLSIPNPDFMYRENIMWSWFSAWGGQSLMLPTGKLNTQFNTEESLINYYNHVGVITKDELPYLARYTKVEPII